jgi:aminoglycoside phosphotransferase (APT) family kinase protein
MDRLPGEPLVLGDPTRSPAVLANAQADLHEIDPTDVIDTLRKCGIDNYWLDNRFAWLGARASEVPAMRECVEWTQENRPKGEPPPVICHGDFHFLNVLFDGAAVSAVLDWSAFTLTDPLFDVAGTLMLFHVHGRVLEENGEMHLPQIDRMIDRYLATYRSRRPLDETHLEYHLALRCTIALTHCLYRPESQPPGLALALANEIYRVSGVHVSVPTR